ncbi:MAG: type II toxin-antitoxin system VapC family toxin [Pseudomonadota bacterium]
MKIICDTHILLFWSQAPERLTAKATAALDEGLERKSLACSDVSFWEIAMLFSRKRLVKPVAPEMFMRDLVLAMELDVLPITPGIAVISQSDLFTHKDPADRLIAATAIHEGSPLITADNQLRSIEGLKAIW